MWDQFCQNPKPTLCASLINGTCRPICWTETKHISLIHVSALCMTSWTPGKTYVWFYCLLDHLTSQVLLICITTQKAHDILYYSKVGNFVAMWLVLINMTPPIKEHAHYFNHSEIQTQLWLLNRTISQGLFE